MEIAALDWSLQTWQRAEQMNWFEAQRRRQRSFWAMEIIVSQLPVSLSWCSGWYTLKFREVTTRLYYDRLWVMCNHLMAAREDNKTRLKQPTGETLHRVLPAVETYPIQISFQILKQISVVRDVRFQFEFSLVCLHTLRYFEMLRSVSLWNCLMEGDEKSVRRIMAHSTLSTVCW